MSVRVNALWVEGSLSYIQRACLSSAVRAGHQVVLYIYRGVDGVPDGITVLDASDILPAERMLRHKVNGSFAVGSDIFRLELLKRGLGYWVDADVYFLKPLDRCDDSYVFGWEDEESICQAVLHIPRDAQLLRDLLDFLNSDVIVPPWWPAENQERQRLSAKDGRALPLEEMPWATTGPRAITHFVKTNNLVAHALPAEVFYPVHWTAANDLFEPQSDIWQRLTDRTKTVHLWNHLIEHRKHTAPAPSSFIDDICRQQAIDYDGAGAEPWTSDPA
jgi:hypothetical protein